MSFHRNYWYYFGAILFVILSFVMGLFGTDIDPQRRILIFGFMAFLVHQFEEYALPGGFPMIWNMVYANEREVPERYPLNKKNSQFVNTFFLYTFYIIVIIFKDWYWLGILSMTFAFAQFVVHGIIIPKKFKSFYNPGIASVIFLQIPVGIYYFWFLATNYDIPTWNWWVGICSVPVAALLLIQLPMLLFQDKNSPYPWSEAEMERFSVKSKLK